MKKNVAKEIIEILADHFQLDNISIKDGEYYTQLSSLINNNRIEYLEFLLRLNNMRIYWFLWDNYFFRFDDYEKLNDCLLKRACVEFRKKMDEYYACSHPTYNLTMSFNTERLTIRPFCEADIEKILNEKDAKAWCVTCNQFNRRDRLTFALVLKDTSEIIGLIGFDDIKNLRKKTCKRAVSLSYYVKERFRGQGYAKEGLTALIHKIFNRGLSLLVETHSFMHELLLTRVNKLEIVCDFDNIASQNVAKSLGFVFENIIEPQYEYEKRRYRYWLQRVDYNKKDLLIQIE